MVKLFVKVRFILTYIKGFFKFKLFAESKIRKQEGVYMPLH